MSDLTCRQTYSVARGELRAVLVDYGENTAGAETERTQGRGHAGIGDNRGVEQANGSE